MPAQECFPLQLKESLGQEGIHFDKVKIIAHTGWTTDELLAGISQAQLDPVYDLVSLLIGVNNQYRGRSLENYRKEFLQLLSRSIGFAGGEAGHVVVLSIPDWGVTPYAVGYNSNQIASEIDAFNAINRDESHKAGTAYLDITSISRLAASSHELLAPDGLHASGLMYGLWVQALSVLVTNLLNK